MVEGAKRAWPRPTATATTAATSTKNSACHPREPRPTGTPVPATERKAVAGAAVAAGEASAARSVSGGTVADPASEENSVAPADTPEKAGAENAGWSSLAENDEDGPEDGDAGTDVDGDDVGSANPGDEAKESDPGAGVPDGEDPVAASAGRPNCTSKPRGTAPVPAGTIISDTDRFDSTDSDSSNRTSAVHVPSAWRFSVALARSHSGLGALSKDCFGPPVHALGVGQTCSWAPLCCTPSAASLRERTAVSRELALTDTRTAPRLIVPAGPAETATPPSGALAAGLLVHQPTSVMVAADSWAVTVAVTDKASHETTAATPKARRLTTAPPHPHRRRCLRVVAGVRPVDGLGRRRRRARDQSPG